MYLKSLELQGFKSFADKTLIRFDDDITAIVGPNGSGKSNISDAIRWVMGEMSSKELRGAKMEDVIFGGTQARPALGFAEATLTLDNSTGAFRMDTPEIAITRRYYRSGESEYYINRQSTRLKDIHELFMDTGLGREGYSNIGQGKIDEIVSLKSTDRREIFEEAAGISKYRHRKEEAERRLANTEDNLLRIGDKISELELQVEPLRKQAETARKYLKLREELKGFEVTVWLDTLSKLSETAKKAEEDYASAAFILEQQHGELERLYALAEQNSLTLNRMTLQADEQRDEFSKVEEEIRAEQTQIAVLSGNIQNREENLARISSEISDHEKRTGSIEEEMQQQTARIEAVRAQIERLQKELQAAIAEGESADESADSLRKEEAELRAKAALCITAISAKRAEIASVRAAAGDAIRQETAIKEDIDASSAKLQEAEAQGEDCAKRLQQARENAQSAENTISGYSLRQKARMERRDSLQKSYDEAEIREGTLRSKLSMYRDMQRDYDGFSKSVKTVMQQAKSGTLRGVYAPVSELISTDDEYTLAIETALGSAMQGIVVENREAAKAVIRMLKQTNGGRVTCWALDAVSPRKLSEKGLEQSRGFVGIAADLVRCESRYENIIRYLLGRVVVAETLDTASAMAQSFGSRFMIVSLDGQVMNAGGSMTGGSASKNAGILSRANAIERLEKDLHTCTEQKEKLFADLTEANRAAEETQYQIETARAQLRTAEDDVLRLTGEEKQIAVLIDAAKEHIALREKELAAIRERTGSVDSRIAALTAEIEQAEAENASIESALEKLSGAFTEIDAHSEEIAERITALKMEVAANDAECETTMQSIASLQQLSDQLRGDRSQKDALISQYNAEIESLRAEIAERTARIEQIQRSLEEKKAAYQQFMEERNALEQARTKTDREAQEKNKEILQMEREAARLEQKKLASSMEEKQIIDRLWDTYELTRTTAQEFTVEIESITAANKRISELRRGISALGTPNVGAIDEFARVNERYTYLTEQRDDVLHSKNELEEIVRSITAEMKDIFVRELEKINTCFGQTFVEMFGGGKASLELEDPEDPLSCGIEIRVQPPGKQLKTITLLSGGEKAFVAIALYFAILKVRPASFCLLDEIDAALDERNVERFAGYLRTLSDKTQFIVITHRRGTMEASQALYGVTMQEKGISRILHIDLNEVQQQLGITE